MTYSCSFCGQEYARPEERARCELSCFDRAVKEQERQKRNQLEAKRKIRSEEIRKKQEELDQLIRSYQRDYGTPHIFDHVLDDWASFISRR